MQFDNDFGAHPHSPSAQGKPTKRCCRLWITGTVLLVIALLALWSLAGVPQSAAQTSDDWTTYANGDDVRALALKDDQVWAGTKGGGVVRWDPAEGLYGQYLRPQDGLAGNNVRDVALGPDDRLWFATDRGVSVLSANGENWTTYDRINTDGGLTSDNVTAIAISANGVLVQTVDWTVAASGR